MPIATFSLLRHRLSTTTNTPLLHFHVRHFTTSLARHHQNPSRVSRKPQPLPNKNLLKAKQNATTLNPVTTTTGDRDFSSLSLSDPPTLSDSQAVGTVAAAQANFMRVIVQSNDTNSNSSYPCVAADDGAENSRNGVELLCVVRALLKKIKRRVLVGDRVLVGSIDWIDRRGMIENVFPRKTEILDPPVANVDHLLVLFSLEHPKLEPFLLTRFLIEAESTGIPFTLALNKVELTDEETVVTWTSRLRSWGYEPLFCSVESKLELDTLAFRLRDQTTVIVGPSGVGKSSLINALRSNYRPRDAATEDNWFEPILGSKWFEDQRVGEVSLRSGRGKHTTRNVSLLPLAGGGYLADTPGFNQPSLMKVTKQSLANTFPEIRKKLKANEPARCAFSDCLHLGEPGCILGGESFERYPFYLQLLDEIRVREEFQLRTFGTKREGDVRYKVGDMGVQQAEPRLEPKKHRRKSRKTINQSIMDELDELLDEDDDSIDEENDPILRALRNEYQK